MKIWNLLVLLSALSATQAAAARDRSYHCVGKLIGIDFKVRDLGRTYPDNDRILQHTYKVTYHAFLRKSGETLLKNVEKTQAYVQNDLTTWKYAFAINPDGGGFDQPRNSIWVTSNDRDVIHAVYYREPYNNQKLRCRKL